MDDRLVFIRGDVFEDSDFESDVQDDSPHPTQHTTDDWSATGDDVDIGASCDAIATAIVP